jgi:hypothetical protein
MKKKSVNLCICPSNHDSESMERTAKRKHRTHAPVRSYSGKNDSSAEVLSSLLKGNRDDLVFIGWDLIRIVSNTTQRFTSRTIYKLLLFCQVTTMA